MGESWLSILLAATLTTMTMTAVTKANSFSTSSTTARDDIIDSKVRADEALDVIEAASTGSLGEVCVNSAGFKSLPADVVLDSRRYDTARQKTDMTARILQNFRVAEAMQRNGELEDK